MKKVFYFILFFSIFSDATCQQWSIPKLIPSSGQMYPVQLLTDNTGNLYLKGSLESATLFYNAQLSKGTFIAKFNNNLQFLWAKSLAGIIKIDLDSKSALNIAGTFTGSLSSDSYNITSAGGTDIYFCKIDSNGQTMRLETFGGTGDEAVAGMDLDKDDEIYLTGAFNDSISFGTKQLKDSSGYNHYYVCCLDTGLNCKWLASGNWNDASGIDVSTDAKKNSYVWGKYLDTCYMCHGGDFKNKFNTAGGRVFNQHNQNYSSHYNIEVNINSVYLHGSGCNPHYCVGYLAKFDTLFNFKWTKALGNGYTFSLARSMSFENENIIVGGGYGSSYVPDSVLIDSVWMHKKGKLADLMVAKLDSAGNYLWFKTAWGNSDEYVEALACDKFNHTFVCGSFSNYFAPPDTVVFDNDTLIGSAIQKQYFLARIDEASSTTTEHTQLKAEQFTIFPNPTSGHFTLQLNDALQKKARQGDMVLVYNVTGNCVLRQQLSNSSTEQIDISKLCKGIYIVEIEYCGGRIIKKIVLN